MIRRTLFIGAVRCFAFPCTASQLLVSSTSARDTALSGSTVAEPRTPSAAMFSNPAGLVLFGEALILPGRYSIDGQIAMIGITWRH